MTFTGAPTTDIGPMPTPKNFKGFVKVYVQGTSDQPAASC